MKSVKEIIQALGGPAKVQAVCGIDFEAIRKWKLFRYVPPKHHHRLVALGKGKVEFTDFAPPRRK